MTRKRTFVLLITGLLLLWVSSAFSATRLYLPDAPEVKAQLNASAAAAGGGLKAGLGLSAQDELELLREVTDESSVTHSRYQQTFNGMPVWGYPSPRPGVAGGRAKRWSLLSDMKNKGF